MIRNSSIVRTREQSDSLTACMRKFWLAVWCLLLPCIFLGACKGENRAPLKIGDQAPEFSATGIHGETISSALHTGAPVILRFFLPDCKFCRADTVVFNDFYSLYKDAGLQIIYVYTGRRSTTVEDFVKELQIAFPVVPDPEKKLADAFRVKALPQTIVLDPAHRIIGAILGGVSKEELDTMLAPFLLKGEKG